MLLNTDLLVFILLGSGVPRPGVASQHVFASRGAAHEQVTFATAGLRCHCGYNAMAQALQYNVQCSRMQAIAIAWLVRLVCVKHEDMNSQPCCC